MFRRFIILISIFLVCLISSAAATDYYVSTTGNNASDGLTVETAWLNVSYGVTQLTTPGDTLYLIDGNWTNEKSEFLVSGNATHPITIKSYNGTPTLYSESALANIDVALDTNSQSYINISGITIKYYWYGVMVVASSHIYVDNVTVYPNGSKGIGFTGVSSYSSATNCTSRGPGWNSFSAGTDGTNNISFINNHIYDNFGVSCAIDSHSGIDLSANINDISIVGNTFDNMQCNAIYAHQYTDIRNLLIENNTIINSANGIHMEHATTNATVNNNTLINNSNSNVTVAHYIQWGTRADSYWSTNTIFSNNTMRGDMLSTQQICTMVGNNTIYRNNDIKSDYNDNEYVIEAYGGEYNTTFIDERDNMSAGSFDVQLGTVGAEIRFTDGKVFSENQYGSPLYYPEWSNYSASGTFTITVIPYNITLVPDVGYGKDVVVNTNLVDDITNITANVSEPATVTMTFLVENVSQTYQLNVNDEYNITAISNSDSIVEFTYYFSDSVSTDFEVLWNSSEGWSASNNITYFNRLHTFYIGNQTIVPTGAQYTDTIVPFWVGGS